jgi:hypothetical protein
VANSTTIVTDLTSVATNGPSSVTQANAIAATALSTVGGSNNMTGTTGIWGSGSTFYGGVMDYQGQVQLAIQKAKELGQLIVRILVNTDASTDATNQALLAKVLNDLQ